VTVSSLLCFVFGGWCWRYAETEGGGYRTLAAVSFGAGVALIAYGFWFWKKINAAQAGPGGGKGGVIAMVLLVYLLGQPAADACTVCYGQAEGPMIDAARSGVWLLFGLVGSMQICFVAFFVYLWRRNRQFHAAHPEELIEP
jgi:hypothetical protein